MAVNHPIEGAIRVQAERVCASRSADRLPKRDWKPIWESNRKTKSELRANGFVAVPLGIMSEMKPPEFLVYVALLSFVWEVGTGRCNPRIATLQTATNLSRVAVLKAAKSLYLSGWIRIHRTKGASEYELISPTSRRERRGQEASRG